jgi:hypothetical protein
MYDIPQKIKILNKCGCMNAVSLGHECPVNESNYYTQQGFTAYIFVINIWENKQDDGILKCTIRSLSKIHSLHNFIMDKIFTS